MAMAMCRYVFVCPYCGEETQKEFIRFTDPKDNKFVPGEAELKLITEDKIIKCEACGNRFDARDENLNYKKSSLL